MTELVLCSKAFWGYDEVFLAACRDELTIKADEVAARRVVVAEDAGRVLGVASLEGVAPHGELGLLFVEPDSIRSGVGRVLYRHVLAAARELGFTRLRIEADPHATPFYRAMGARQVGTGMPGSVPGRGLPMLDVALAASPGWVQAWTAGQRAVHLGNVGEFQEQFSGISPVSGQTNHYACLSAFASPHPAVLVLPATVPAGWVELVARELGWEPVEVFDGLDDPVGLCAGVLARPALSAYLRGLGLPLLPWGQTMASADLAGQSWRPETLQYESKRTAHALFVRLAPGHPEITVPAQWLTATRWAAARRLRSRVRAGKATVVKTEHGAGGSGTWVVNGHQAGRRDKRWFRLPPGPLLLEEYVAGTGSPRDLTYDGLVDADGTVHDVGVAVMDVRGTAYLGATVGPGAVPPQAEVTATRFGHDVGRELAVAGYRGWYDVDFVTGTDGSAGRLAPTEVNLRLTGPAVAFTTKARLDEIRGGDHLVRTIDQVPLGARLPERELSTLLSQLARTCAEIGAVLIPTIPTAVFEPALPGGGAGSAHRRRP